MDSHTVYVLSIYVNTYPYFSHETVALSALLKHKTHTDKPVQACIKVLLWNGRPKHQKWSNQVFPRLPPNHAGIPTTLLLRLHGQLYQRGKRDGKTSPWTRTDTKPQQWRELRRMSGSTWKKWDIISIIFSGSLLLFCQTSFPFCLTGPRTIFLSLVYCHLDFKKIMFPTA